MRFATLLAAGTLASGCLDVTVDKNVPYDDRYDVAVLDIYRPPPADMPRPAVVTIHGGGWHTGIYRSSLAGIAERLADAGYITLNIEYRLVGNGGEFPHAIQDCLCALAWTRAHAGELGIDPTRVAGLGYSAGGHLVSMLGVASDVASVQPDCAAGPAAPFDAVVSGAGPEDMRDLAWADAVQDFIGGSLSEFPDRYDDASPILHVRPGAPPFLFVHGTNDYFVPIAHSRDMARELDDVGTDARLLEVPGGGHIWNDAGGDWELPLTSIDTPAAQAAIIDFLDDTIGPVP
jgi:acetyl esterase/lipase